MKLSCCVWALDYGKNGPARFFRKLIRKVAPEVSMLTGMAELGFRSVDIQPNMQKTTAAQSKLKQLNLDISCVSLCHHAPEGASFHSKDANHVKALIDHTNRGIDHAAKIGAPVAYVVPGQTNENQSQASFATHYEALAERGQQLGVKVGIEHFPKTAFPTVKSTLDFIEEVNHPNLYLLFDIGHAQISNEKPSEVLPLAGDRLCYVHLDDNDGKDDLHLSLTDGVQSRNDLESLFNVLQEIHYSGAVSLELHPHLPNPFEALRKSKQIIENMYAFE